MRHFIYLIKFITLVLLTIFTQVSFAASTGISVEILGYPYEVVLEENTELDDKIVGVEQNDTTKHYVGSVAGVEQSWVRVSNIDGSWVGVVSLYGEMYALDETIASDTSVQAAVSGLAATPMSEMSEFAGTCGSGEHMHSILESTVASASSASNDGEGSNAPAVAQSFAAFCNDQVNGICAIAEVEVAFDLQFQAFFGGQSASQAAAIMNIVDGHYINDLNISIDSISIVLLNNDLFDVTTNAMTLLTDIANKKDNGQIPFITNNNALTHLVTGRNLDGNTLGVAFLGTVCRADGGSTGLSSLFLNNLGVPSIALSAIVVAHELGHNLGSNHDGPAEGNAACPINTFIMSPGLGPGITNFSFCSAEEIEAALSAPAVSNNPQLCLDFPADVSVIENPGNNATLDANQEFTSAYTVVLNNGFIAVNNVRVDGSVDINNAEFVAVTANGAACSIAPDGGSYTCNVAAPGNSIALIARVRAAQADINLLITQTAIEQTNDVQDVNAGNNTLVSSFSIVAGDVTSTTPPPNTPTNNPPTNNSPQDDIANEDDGDDSDGGGGGSFDTYFLLAALTLFGFARRREFS